MLRDLNMKVLSILQQPRAMGFRGFQKLSTPLLTRTSPWKTQVDREYLESHGDFGIEASCEDPQKPLYLHQADLPRLPVPSLEETIDTFLPTALPLAKSHEEAETLEAACRSFPEQAAALQERLLQRKEENPNSSWLQKWWNESVYLNCRESNTYNVSFFFRLPDDHNVTSHNEPAITRGAAVLEAAVEYAQTIESGQKPADIAGYRKPGILCSTQYKYLFSACRIPRRGQDSFRVYQPTDTPRATVACRGQFYSVPLTDDQGNILSRSELQAVLRDCASQSRRLSRSVPQLGWLTTTSRDNWADAYKLFSHTSDLHEALEALQSGLCMLCLDLDDDLGEEKKSDSFQDPSETQLALQFLHGNMDYTANRWFDKSMQVVVTSQGSLGYVGEHAMSDGMPSAGFWKYLLERCKSQVDDNFVTASHGPRATPIFEHAFQTLSQTDRKDFRERVRQARKYFYNKTFQPHELEAVHYRKHGCEAIKQAGLSPDAYVQMAIQLASYRCFGEFVGTYEAIQTRKFLHGRTETTRTVSPASVAFCQAMQSNTESVDKKSDLLQQAIESHVNYTRKAFNGMGVDRHFFGLGMLLQDGETPPDLFQHPLYQRSKRWRLSTSTVPGCALGFGNVVSDGMGIGYDTRQQDIIFHVSARKEHNYVNIMSRLLVESLDEMRCLVLDS